MRETIKAELPNGRWESWGRVLMWPFRGSPGQGNGCDGSEQLSRNGQRSKAGQRQGTPRPETTPACKANSCQSFRNRWKSREKSVCLAEHSCLSMWCLQHEGRSLPARPWYTPGCHASSLPSPLSPLALRF